MEENLSALTKFLIKPELRWIFYFVALFLTVIAFIQEPLRFSVAKGSFGLPFNWETYILGVLNLLNYFLSFFALWLTIPFVFTFPDYWFITLFVFLIALYTEIFVNTKTYKKNDSFQPPPTYIYPKKYRMIIFYFILIFDVIIFTQFLLSSGNISENVKTLLDKYLLGRFGGWIEGNRINFVVSWLGTIGIIFDLYNIYNQQKFVACSVELPDTWNF